MKHSDLKEGMFVYVDGGFTCMRQGLYKVMNADGDFYLNCDAGYHILTSDDEEGNLIGIDNEEDDFISMCSPRMSARTKNIIGD
jgi:hypothetical protein